MKAVRIFLPSYPIAKGGLMSTLFHYALFSGKKKKGKKGEKRKPCFCIFTTQICYDLSLAQTYFRNSNNLAVEYDYKRKQAVKPQKKQKHMGC